MVVCRYFLQNRCSFGDRCRYEHKITFENLNVNQRVEFIHNNLMEWINSGMWLLSKYVPFENYSEFRDFVNVSFEEDRYNFYNARENGTLSQYIANITELKNKVKSRINNYINNPTNIYNELRNIIKIDIGNNQIENNAAFAFMTPPQLQLQPQIQTQPQPSMFNNSVTFGNGFQTGFVTPMESESETNNNNNNNITSINVPCIYSKMEDLCEWEIEAYKADHFEFGKIPVKPPPLDLC